MFRLNSQCNRRLTCSPKRVDLTNQKRLAVYACANRDVFEEFLSSRRHNLPSKAKLRNNQLNGMSTCRCNNNAIVSDKAIFTFPTVDVCLPLSIDSIHGQRNPHRERGLAGMGNGCFAELCCYVPLCPCELRYSSSKDISFHRFPGDKVAGRECIFKSRRDMPLL